ncbi:MAG: aminoacyl-tRNA hydrolase [Desulfobacterales bacterium]|nr:aminoacyl-tRNA hydrolase [Desulfobacterales bacterium]MCP4163224.1 aminoacyl-tRNA hydrolase [Deltaproteobacteria bacterium]
MGKKLYLIAGLGNPGDKYKKTRHNIGFNVVQELSQEYNIPLSKEKFSAEFGKGKINNCDVILVKPMSFMNLSGEPVQKITNFYNIDTDDVIIVHDDLDIEIGSIKLKVKGGHGGHNGIKSLISNIGKEFVRIRIGIGRPDGKGDVSDFVLGKFQKQDKDIIAEILYMTKKAVISILEDGPAAAMNEFNRSKQ